jgi:hypothetical protein
MAEMVFAGGDRRLTFDEGRKGARFVGLLAV